MKNMLYREYKPSVLLSSYIETYWFSEGFTGEEESYKIFPDGCVDIIFILNKVRNTLNAEIVGTMTTFLDINFPELVQIFGIRFKPAGITAFTRNPVNEFTDNDVELALVETLFSKSFYEILPEKQSIEDVIKYTDNYLIDCLPSLHQPDKQIISAVNLICSTHGQLSLSEAASEVCLSQRHFERKFKSVIGISPKTFAKIVRFKYALQYLRNYPNKDLLSVAIQCGYYDHTHLIKDFKIISGSTPDIIRR